MKITASFISTRPILALPLIGSLAALALLFVVISCFMIIGILDMHAEQPRLDSRLSKLNKQIASVAPHDPLPPAPELESLRQRVYALNKLSGLRGWSTPQLLTWLEEKLPERVHLASLHHKPREGEALLVAESHSAEALTEFLLQLEKEIRFAEVLLNKQGARSGPGANTVQFEIRVRWK